MTKQCRCCENEYVKSEQNKENYKGKNKQLNQRKTKKEHQKQKIDTVFLTAFVYNEPERLIPFGKIRYNELIKQERKP